MYVCNHPVYKKVLKKRRYYKKHSFFKFLLGRFELGFEIRPFSLPNSKTVLLLCILQIFFSEGGVLRIVRACTSLLKISLKNMIFTRHLGSQAHNFYMYRMRQKNAKSKLAVKFFLYHLVTSIELSVYNWKQYVTTKWVYFI